MKHLIESGAARIVAGIQRFGAPFDLEVLSLPGGSVIAALLWLCASTKATPKRIGPQFRVVDEVSTVHAVKILRESARMNYPLSDATTRQVAESST
jgi:hypothetical protein